MRTAIDLFAGAGGATQGLRDAGFVVLAAAENDNNAAESFAANHPDVIMAGDVRGIVPYRLRRFLGLQRGELDILKACPPCQGFSSLTRTSSDPLRNDLVLDVLRFVLDFRPKAVIVENVPGLARDERLPILLHAMEGAGYEHSTYTVDARNFGVPQRRRRLIVLAVRRSITSELPRDLQDLVPPQFDLSHRTAGEALDELAKHLSPGDPCNRFRKSNPSVTARISAIPIGGDRFDLPPQHQLKCHTRLTESGQSQRVGATASYGRVRTGEAAPTMTTRCTTPACGSFVHPTENRGLTLREAATFQTFPPNYHFHGGYDSIERQIGNAVPVRLATALGLVVQTMLTRASPFEKWMSA
ncbi:DNA (cytosine-5-)-methyltransferase [Nostocoides sp. F2B08]|uniref:DNA cytosine methyltransferase n=1 Tax=Nostocoides sp. F2B08 TaxID=2653936 RepID=UPI001263B0F8|nr:DNA (cytosine-5-)-methyltransferase [Tetrasphaera sp. F2B08]